MNPVAFTFFNFEVRWYSLFILLGVILAYFLLSHEGKRFKIPTDYLFNMFFWALLFGIVGARLYYVAFNWDYFSHNLSEIWKIWEGGLAIHGGIIFGLITIMLYCKKYNVRLTRILDICAPALILAQAIGRWGNFFNSEAYGAATTLNHLKSLHIPDFIINGMNINGVYYTPTFLYESLWCLLGFIILLILRRRRLAKVGDMVSFYLVWYGLGRFLIESSRTDSLMFFGFKAAHIVSAVMILVGITIIIINTKKRKFEDLYNDMNNVDVIRF